MNEPTDHTPAWLEWLKKPENLMTGIVLAAGLMQDRRPGQSRTDALGQRALGALAFRGGLDLGVKEQQRQEAEDRSRQGYRQGQIDVSKEHIATQRSEGAANRTAAKENTQATIQGQKDLRGIPQAQTPAEGAYTGALTTEALSRARLNDRMPVGRAGSGSNPDDPLGGDLYEQEMFKQWAAADMAQAQATGQPYVMDPMKWLTYVQPYRNAKVVLTQMEHNGLPGEIYKDDKGTFRVRIANVAAPQPGPDTVPGVQADAPVELTPTSIESAAAASTKRKEAEMATQAAAAEAARPATPEEMKPFMDKLPALSNKELEALMRSKDLPIEQVRVIRTELRRRSDEKRAEKVRNSQVSGLR